MNTAWVYELAGIQKVYEGRTVLNIERLNIPPGELFAVVGPSGAGKSTLLRIMNFLEAPSAGLVKYNGVPVSLPLSIEGRREMGMLFQRPKLLKASVRYNVSYPLILRGMPDEARVDDALEAMDLKGLENASAKNLSGGEVQRVALARVLVTKPKVLLLDEPTANLDPYNVDLIERTARRLSKDGTSIVLVTHNVFQARRLANRVGLMLNGEFVEISETEKFFTDPDEQRAIDFVNGKMVY